MLKTYQFKTQCKGDIHSSKTTNIILPGLVTEYRWTPLSVQARAWVQCELRVVKLRVGILLVDVQAKRARIWLSERWVNVRVAYWKTEDYSSNQL